MNTKDRSMRPLLTAACLFGGMLFAPSAVLAHDANEHA